MIDHEKMVQDFISSQTSNCLEEDLWKISQEFPAHRESITLSLATSISQLCRQASLMQAAGKKGAAEYLWISFLRTNILEDNWQYRLDLYDERFLFDQDECAVLWEMDFVFHHLRERVERLVQTARSRIYANKIRPRHLDALKFKLAAQYNQAAIKITGEIIADAIRTSEYDYLIKAPNLKIVMGEYLDQFVLLYESENDNTR